MKYRREIDGLRALAVVPVILFHAGFHVFGGGFIGVDVFFVISGYLITSIVISELQEGKFSLATFYERRARRILPALFLMMIVCIPFAWFWLLPGDMIGFAKSLAAVPIFSSNILFWQEAGYFDSSTELKPLLHTWSLAVEEQYYVLFPLFLMLVWSVGKSRLMVTLAVVATASLALAHWGSLQKPIATFYLLPTRGWELLMGSFVAFHLSGRSDLDHGRLSRETGAAAGLAMLLYSVVAFDRNTPFPSLYALIPTIGTSLLILFATPSTTVGKVLGSRPLVGVGLISYSAYLWHQPIFAFARHRLDQPGPETFGVLSLAALSIAYFAWRFVEQPFRQKGRFDRPQIVKAAVASSTVIVSLGLVAANGGVKSYFELSKPYLIQVDSKPSSPELFSPCMPPMQTFGTAVCTQSGSGAKRVVVWGDSHADVLRENVPDVPGVTFYFVFHSGCPPVKGVRRFDSPGRTTNCSNQDVIESYARYIDALSPDIVILVARWTMYLEGWQKRGVLQPVHHYVTDSRETVTSNSLADRQRALIAGLERTTGSFQSKPHFLLLSQPPDLSTVGFRNVYSDDLNVPRFIVDKWHRSEDELVGHVSKFEHVEIIDSKRYFCDEKACKTRIDGRLLYYDDNHLSNFGLQYLWKRLVAEIPLGAQDR